MEIYQEVLTFPSVCQNRPSLRPLSNANERVSIETNGYPQRVKLRANTANYFIRRQSYLYNSFLSDMFLCLKMQRSHAGDGSSGYATKLSSLKMAKLRFLQGEAMLTSPVEENRKPHVHLEKSHRLFRCRIV